MFMSLQTLVDSYYRGSLCRSGLTNNLYAFANTSPENICKRPKQLQNLFWAKCKSLLAHFDFYDEKVGSITCARVPTEPIQSSSKSS